MRTPGLRGREFGKADRGRQVHGQLGCEINVSTPTIGSAMAVHSEHHGEPRVSGQERRERLKMCTRKCKQDSNSKQKA
jgi:hypothetical protein